MEFPWPYIVTLFLTSIIGGGLMLLRVKQSDRGLRLLLAFSAAYLLGLVMLHLLPELFHSEADDLGWYILAGFLLQIVLDFFSHGVEHGHAHIHRNEGARFLVMVVISLWIHAFIEGMPFGSAAGTSHDHIGHDQSLHDHRDSLVVGIGLHKVTEAFVFVSLLINLGFSRSRGLMWLIFFGLVAPAGAAVQYFLGIHGLVSLDVFMPRILAVLVGIILHVATTILFESSEGHHFNLRKFIAILLGIASSMLAGIH